MSSTYVDGSTPLDAAHMNALQQKVEKGLANGYASLDATTKVPIAQLPGAGTLPSPVVNGQWLKGVGGAAVWTALAPADLPAMSTFGTTFPGSPVDGQEHTLVDTTTGTPVYSWRFRYCAGNADPYRWLFVGGASWIVGTTGYMATTATTNTDLTSGPTMTMPKEGYYKVEFGLHTVCTAVTGVFTGYAHCFSSLNGAGYEANINYPQSYIGGYLVGSEPRLFAAGDALKIRCRISGTNSTVFESAWIIVTPMRLIGG